MENQIQATTFVELIKEAAVKGKKEVEVLFHPPYDEGLHGGLRPELKKLLKQNKTSVFSVIEEGDDILFLTKSKDVISIKWK